MTAAAGIVKVQAKMIDFPTDQRTALSLFTAPTPIMTEVMTCVVEMGMPRAAVVMRMHEEVVSAAKPLIG